MSGRSSNVEHVGYALKAYYSVLRLIQVGIENASQSWKEIQKLLAQADATAGPSDKDKKTKQPTGANAAAAASINESDGKKSKLGGDGGGRSNSIFSRF